MRGRSLGAAPVGERGDAYIHFASIVGSTAAVVLRTRTEMWRVGFFSGRRRAGAVAYVLLGVTPRLQLYTR